MEHCDLWRLLVLQNSRTRNWVRHASLPRKRLTNSPSECCSAQSLPVWYSQPSTSRIFSYNVKGSTDMSVPVADCPTVHVRPKLQRHSNQTWKACETLQCQVMPSHQSLRGRRTERLARAGKDDLRDSQGEDGKNLVRHTGRWGRRKKCQRLQLTCVNKTESARRRPNLELRTKISTDSGKYTSEVQF